MSRKTLLDGFGEATEEVVALRREVERLRAILHVVADCSENDDVAFGDHLCIEQIRVEVRRLSKNG